MEARRAARLYQESDAGRWKVPAEVLSNALERSAEKTFGPSSPSDADLDRYFDSLHLADLALACACAIGRNEAWDHFVRELRPGMYRAADAIDPAGGAREIAETLYAELFGLKELDGRRQSVFRYFHGRSSLATWLRSLIAQRFVDRHRETRRLEPLPEDSSPASSAGTSRPKHRDRGRAAATPDRDACVDPETLGAWADGGLDPAQMAAVELHVGSCARCQAIVGMTARSAPIAPAPEAPVGFSPWKWWLAPIAVGAAAGIRRITDWRKK